MFGSYLTVALRNLRKQAGFSVINVGGLAVGLACAFLIVLYIQHEIAFDRFQEKGDRIQRLILERQDEQGTSRQAVTASGFAPEITERFPEIEQAVRLDYRGGGLLVDNRRLGTRNFLVADAAFFEVFTFPLLRGDPATVLSAPDALVLTESTARNLFGDQDPIGRVVHYADRVDLRVTGIAKDPPANTHLPFEYVAPMELMTTFMGPDALHEFTNFNYYTYVQLAPGSDPVALTEKINGYFAERFGPEEAEGQRAVLQPLSEIHFTTDIRWDVPSNTDFRSILVFGAIGLLVLLIACINFMNLATARAMQRAREIGVRKAVGAHRRQVAMQFLFESVLMAMISVGLALGLAAVGHPFLAEFVGTMGTILDNGLGTMGLLVGIGLAAGLLAGSYPAIYLSGFQPTAVLKGERVGGRGAARLRHALIVGQFAVSVFLIIGTLTVRSQLRHMRVQELGYQGDQVLSLPLVAPLRDQYNAFRQTLLEQPHMLSVARAGNMPGRVNTSRGYNWPGAVDEENGRSFLTMLADFGYLETLGLDLVAGRDFDRQFPADEEDAYILNQAAVRELGWTDAVDQPFRAWDREMGRVIGVVRDFHFKSLQQQIEPIVINVKPDWAGNVLIRFARDDVPAALAVVERQWQAFAPGFPFDYRFLDQDFDRLYRAEDRLARLFSVFAAIAIFVACMGLFGLAAYSAARRTKEIGVRKVMGATELGVAMLLTREFTILVGVGFALAVVPAIVLMENWLSQFAYRIDMPWALFVASGLIALVVAWATVMFQATKAARTDPVRALRYE